MSWPAIRSAALALRRPKGRDASTRRPLWSFTIEAERSRTCPDEREPFIVGRGGGVCISLQKRCYPDLSKPLLGSAAPMINTQAVYNAVLCEPTLLYGWKRVKDFSGIVGLLLQKDDPQVEKYIVTPDEVGEALDFYICTMLAACAGTISIPAHGDSMWASPGQLKSLLSDSGAKRLRFVDRTQTTWAAIESYLRPVHNDITKASGGGATRDHSSPLHQIAWDVYLLCLAVSGHSEAPVLPSRTIGALRALGTEFPLGVESRARLATVEGTFALFNKAADIPGFKCIPGRARSLAERLDEILDDAYLLDASRLRRFLAVQSNTRAIRRDLRKLVAFIAKSRPWAKGALVASSHAACIPASAAQAADKLVEILPSGATEYCAPALIDPESFVNSDQKLFVVSSQRVPFSEKESWTVTIRRHDRQAQRRFTEWRPREALRRLGSQ